MSALISGEQRQAVLFDGKNLEDVEKLKCLGSMFVANDQGTEEISSRINLARSAFIRLQSGLWSRREISLRTNGQGLPGSSELNFTLRLRDMACTSSRWKDVGVLWQWQHPPHSNVRTKNAPLVWTCRKTSRGWVDQGPSPPHTTSHVVQKSWWPAEDMGYHDQGRPGTDLRTASLRPPTIEKGLGEIVL